MSITEKSLDHAYFIIKILTARLSIVACFLLSFVTVLLRSGLGRRLVRTTNLSIMCFYNNLNKTPSPCQGSR